MGVNPLHPRERAGFHHRIGHADSVQLVHYILKKQDRDCQERDHKAFIEEKEESPSVPINFHPIMNSQRFSQADSVVPPENCRSGRERNGCFNR